MPVSPVRKVFALAGTVRRFRNPFITRRAHL